MVGSLRPACAEVVEPLADGAFIAHRGQGLPRPASIIPCRLPDNPWPDQAAPFTPSTPSPYTPSTPSVPSSTRIPRVTVSKSGKALGIVKIQEPAVIGDFYDFGTILGRGGFAMVAEIYHAKTFQPFAGKVVRKERGFADANSEAVFRRVMETLLNVENPCVAKILHTFEDASCYYLVMDVCKGGTLRELIFGSDRKLPSHMLDEISEQALTAMGFLHQLGLLHRDIKPDNMMLANAEEVMDEVWAGMKPVKLKLVDFDMCRFFDSGQQVKESKLWGTPGFLAPEIVASCRYSVRSDIYAFGCVLFVALNSQNPCEELTISSMPVLEMCRIVDAWLDDAHRMCRQAELHAQQEQASSPCVGSTVSTRCSSSTSACPPGGGQTYQEVPLRLWRLMAWCVERDPLLRPESAEAILRSGLLREGDSGSPKSPANQPSEAVPISPGLQKRARLRRSTTDSNLSTSSQRALAVSAVSPKLPVTCQRFGEVASTQQPAAEQRTTPRTTIHDLLKLGQTTCTFGPQPGRDPTSSKSCAENGLLASGHERINSKSSASGSELDVPRTSSLPDVHHSQLAQEHAKPRALPSSALRTRTGSDTSTTFFRRMRPMTPALYGIGGSHRRSSSQPMGSVQREVSCAERESRMPRGRMP